MGCKLGDIKLILITHGDSDHTGNAAYLRKKHTAKISMHKNDLEMVEKGDMSYNRKVNFITRIVFSLPFIKLSKSDRFIPDSYVEDGQDLSDYGFDAEVIHILGHSEGSIGILTEDGNLFCGDLLENTKKPVINSIMGDMVAVNDSFEKLRKLNINTVYPCHGKTFKMDYL
ncbi:MBL fold metallo-hydrolase [Methanobacterium sp.]|uniref:MBL fold metallo-hydrolase n=1 Tax=Methanobacterium sp. TaxID=2164 RepID=UPI0031588A8B